MELPIDSMRFTVLRDLNFTRRVKDMYVGGYHRDRIFSLVGTTFGYVKSYEVRLGRICIWHCEEEEHQGIRDCYGRMKFSSMLRKRLGSLHEAKRIPFSRNIKANPSDSFTL